MPYIREFKVIFWREEQIHQQIYDSLLQNTWQYAMNQPAY